MPSKTNVVGFILGHYSVLIQAIFKGWVRNSSI